MTKICPKCGKGNLDTAKFCEDCGNTLGSTSIDSKANSKELKGWWNNQSSRGKAITGIGGVCCIGLIILVLFAGIMSPDVNTSNTTTQSSNDANSKNTTSQPETALAGNEYTIGNSKFRLSGDWKEGFRSDGAEDLERIRLDGNGKVIIMTQYFDKSKYNSESENAINTKTISGIKCKMISGYPAIVWFEKNGKYYQVTVNNIDSSGNFEDGTDAEVKYIEEIIGSIQ